MSWITQEEFQRKMTDIANEHTAAMAGMNGSEATTYVKGVIARATLVFGVWQDAEAPNGVGMHVIKGRRDMRVVIASGQNEAFRTEAIPFVDLEQAIAAEQMWGDGQIKSDS